MDNTNRDQHMKIDLVAKTIEGNQVSVECEISGECGIKFAVGVLKEVISKSELLQEALPIAMLDLKIKEIEKMLSNKED
jgi:hypothetical protein